MSNYVYRLATEYRDAGISVIPLRTDGSKAPASHLLPQVCDVKTKKQSGTWEPFSHRLATDDELCEWFEQQIGIGMVCGSISGGLEVIDFDDGDLFPPWREKVASIVDLLPVIETPSGGWHVLFRCDAIGGNCKIAMDHKRQKKTLIETRGEGGYIVAEGSPCDTHATGLPYAQSSGPLLPVVPRITPDDRRVLWAAARTFDRSDIAGEIRRKQQARQRAGRSYQQDDTRESWPDILEPHGWTSRDGQHWTRPGKKYGTSARIVLASDGTELLTVFSANCGPLSPTGSYRTWGRRAAIRALGGQL